MFVGEGRVYLKQQINRTNHWMIIILFLAQILLVIGFILFIIFTNQVVNQQQQTPLIDTYNGISNVELSPKGLEVFQSMDKMYLIPIYKRAAAKYNIPWEYLAAINYVESTLWTNRSASSVGAVGPMQFMERTWVGWSEDFFRVYPDARTPNSSLGDINDKYHDVIKRPEVIKRFGGVGEDGNGDGLADPFNEEDAIFTAAKLLAQNGMAEGKVDKAIFAYNHSWKYVQNVKQKANEFTQPIANQQPINGGTDSPVFGWPLARTDGVEMTSPYSYGYCTVYRGSTRCNHGGIDLAAPNIAGDTILAAADGMAYSRVEWDGCGYYVFIQHGNGYETYYCHMIEPSPISSAGQYVRKGEPIGKVGSTGRSSGPHLHYAVKVNGTRVDPYEGYITIPSNVRVYPIQKK